MLNRLRHRLIDVLQPRDTEPNDPIPCEAKAMHAPATASHDTVHELIQDGSGLVLRKIASEAVCDAIDEATRGYNAFGNEWWSNPACPYAYKYLSLDSLYRPEYFGPGIGHPEKHTAVDLYQYMQTIHRGLFGRPFSSIIELGTGGGEITVAFAEEGLDYLAVEGTSAGVEALLAKGVDAGRILKCNLKFLPDQGRRFDIAMCTEVMEHVEPFFASKIADNCIRHSDLVWFSAADRNRRAHYHHSNEQPIEVWDNLFAHMGYPWFVPLNGLHDRASRLYMSERVGTQFTEDRSVAAPFGPVAESKA